MAKKLRRRTFLILGILGVGLISLIQGMFGSGYKDEKKGSLSYGDLQDLLAPNKALADAPYSQGSYYGQGYGQGYYQGYYQDYYQGYYQDSYQSGYGDGPAGGCPSPDPCPDPGGDPGPAMTASEARYMQKQEEGLV